MIYVLQQTIFVLRYRYLSKGISFFRKIFFSIVGMKIGDGTFLPRLYITWPHQVSIGKDCILEHNIYFKYDGIWSLGPSIRVQNNVFLGSGCEFNIRQSIDIGDNCLIASGCRFIDHDHGTQLNSLMRSQDQIEKSIMIGSNVWIGCNVVVLKGVEIGDGSIVAAGAVVTKSILPLEIWAGVPARKIGERGPGNYDVHSINLSL